MPAALACRVTPRRGRGQGGGQVMEYVVYPRAFTVQPGAMPRPRGEQAPTMNVVLHDVAGNVVRLVFALEDWRGFQSYVADHEAAAKAAATRRLLLGPDGRAPTLKGPKH